MPTPRRRAALAAVAAGVLLLGAWPAGAARDDRTASPAVPGTVILPGITSDAIAADLGGDGGRQLIRVVSGPPPDGSVAVEAWQERGGWQRLGPPVELRRLADFGEMRGATLARLDRHGRLPVTATDGVRLVGLRVNGRPQVAVPSSVLVTTACCSSVGLVGLGSGGPAVASVGEHLVPFDAVVAADLNGDGTDELVTRDAFPVGAAVRLRVYRLRDGWFRMVGAVNLPADGNEPPFRLGNTDGRPGEEVAIVSRVLSGRLYRLRLDAAGQVSLDATTLFSASDPRQELSGVLALPDGRLAVANVGHTYLASWPAGGAQRVLASAAVGGTLLGFVGSGRRLAILVAELSGEVVALDGSLRPVPVTGGANATIWPPWLDPYRGPLDLPGLPRAVLADGHAYTGDAAGIQAAAVTPLALAAPIGPLGASGSWMAVLRRVPGKAHGSLLRRAADESVAALSIVPAAALLGSGPLTLPTARLRPAAAAFAASRPGTLLVRQGGFALAAAAPPGAVLLLAGTWNLGLGDGVPGGYPAEVAHRVAAPDGVGQLEVAVVTPDGRALPTRLEVRAIAPRPDLSVDARTDLGQLTATLSGRTTPGTRITADGRALAVAADGTFTARLAAAPWPTVVDLLATDPLGGETRRQLRVVGLVDYLRVPWLAVAAALIVLLAFRAALRPSAARLARSGGFEELEPPTLS